MRLKITYTHTATDNARIPFRRRCINRQKPPAIMPACAAPSGSFCDARASSVTGYCSGQGYVCCSRCNGKSRKHDNHDSGPVCTVSAVRRVRRFCADAVFGRRHCLPPLHPWISCPAAGRFRRVFAAGDKQRGLPRISRSKYPQVRL